MSAHIIGDQRTRGSSGRDNRMFVEAVLWIVRTGSPWRDLPDAFGDWNSVFRRFSRWSHKGVWWRIFGDVGRSRLRISDRRFHYHPRPPARFGCQKRGLKIRPLAVRAVA